MALIYPTILLVMLSLLIIRLDMRQQSALDQLAAQQGCAWQFQDRGPLHTTGLHLVCEAHP